MGVLYFLSYVSLSLWILQFHKILFLDIFSSNNSSAMFSLSSSSGTPIIWLWKHLALLIICSVFVYPTVFLSVVQFQYFLFIYTWTHWLFFSDALSLMMNLANVFFKFDIRIFISSIPTWLFYSAISAENTLLVTHIINLVQ